MNDSTRTGGVPASGPAERTTLAWTRTSFACLGNGALLAIKDLHGSAGPAARILAIFATVVALCTDVIAVRRQRTLAERPMSTRITARRQVYIVGMAVVVLVVATAAIQLVT